MPETNRQPPAYATAPILAALVLTCAAPVLAQEPLPASPQAAGQAGFASTADNRAATCSRTVGAGMAGLQAYQRQYDEALANGLYGEAETLAKRMIDVLLARGGNGQTPMAHALSRLAFAQRQRELYAAASRNYMAAIDLLQSRENRLSEELIDPLRGLGDTYMASGRAELAVAAYEQALHIRRVNDGPHTLEQVELLDEIVTARQESGDTKGALHAVDRMYHVYARTYATESEEVLPALQRKADLLNVLGRYQQERAVYRDIVGIIRDRRGEYDLSLLERYSAMAHTYFYDLDEAYFRSEPTTETGETFLKNALEVTQKNPEATWLMQEHALIELGDYYTVRDIQDRARIHYGRAWGLLSADASRLDRRHRDLGRPVTLLRTDLDPYANFGYGSADDRAEPEDYLDGYVVVSFIVNDRGRALDVVVADADPAGFAAMEERVMHAVRDFIFRPRYHDGRPVYSPGQRFRHDYRYLESDLETTD